MSISKRLRFLVFRRDGFSCVYCGRRAPAVTLEVDHRIPRFQGGGDDPGNLVAACWDCNRGKGPLDLEEFKEYRDTWLLWPHRSEWEENSASGAVVHAAEFVDLYSELPKWLLPPRERYHINLNFDLLSAVAELAQPNQITIMRPEAIYEIASVFDPASEVC